MTTTTPSVVRRPTDAFPKDLIDEYRRLARIPNPILMVWDENNFECRSNADSQILQLCHTGQDYAGTMAALQWIANGPKIADVTEDQYAALSKIEVRLEVKDFQMPYSTMLINMPPGKMHRFVILYRSEVPHPILIALCMSPGNTNDIVTVARQIDGGILEETLGKYYGDVTAEEGSAAHECLRVACNMVLAMTNFGCQSTYLFPGEIAQEKKYQAKGDRVGRSGMRPSDRIRESPILVTLDRNVKLYHREGGHLAGEPTGREMPFHWRRGHWRRAKVGVGRTETKIIFVRPCMVRADMLGATSPTDTNTTYHK